MNADRQISNPATWTDTHGDALFRFAMMRVRDPAVAEDLVQDTLLAALTASDTFAGRSSERTWLIGILKHKITDWIRRVSRERPITEEQQAADWVEQAFDASGHWRDGPRHGPTDPSRDTENREFWEILRHCISQLPMTLAGAFTLREMENLATEEVCKLLDVSASNLWTRLHRARMLLRKCLEANWFAGSG